VVRVPGYRTDMYCVSCEVRTEFIYAMWKKIDRLNGLVVRVPGYRSRGPGSIPGDNSVQLDRLCGLVVRVLGYRSGGPGSIPGTTKKKSNGSGTGSTQPREYN
jgi:hypothetical protein